MNCNIQTPWESAENLVKQIKIGDLIEIKRSIAVGIPFYYHWAVYIGLKNGIHKVVHFSNKEGDGKVLSLVKNTVSSIFGGVGDSSEVKIDNFFDVCRDDKCRINNSMDKDCEPYSVEEICQRALKRVGDFKYSLLSYNCEHFAKWARYDLAISDQGIVGKSLVMAGYCFLRTYNIYIALAIGVAGYVTFKVTNYMKKKRFSRGSSNCNHLEKQLVVLPA